MSESASQDASVMNASTSQQAIRIYGVVLSVGVACSLAIVTAYEGTRPIIERNKIALRQAAILDVLPGAITSAAFSRDETSAQFQPASPGEDQGDRVFAGFDQAGKLVGLAIEARAMGYQDFIQLLYGYSIDTQAIIGIRVLESRETPGLGDRIESDANFLRNFEHLDVSVDSAGTQLAHPIEFVKPGAKSADWQIDGITGATISSRATAGMIRDSAAHWIPLVYPRRSDFRPPQGEE